jgi:hypothetical protein
MIRPPPRAGRAAPFPGRTRSSRGETRGIDMQMTVRTRLAVLFAGVLATACGGGDGGAPAPAPAPAPTPVAAQLRADSGDAQVGAPGTALPAAPTVLVTDANGAPVAGIAVAFAVADGNGSIAANAAVTGSDGKASAGAWTLPATKGIDRLTATVAGLAPVTFTASSLVNTPGFTVSQSLYMPGAFVGDSTPVQAVAQSPLGVITVTASIAGHATMLGLQPAPPANTWAGTLDLTGLPSGPVELVLEAYDLGGRESDALFQLDLNRKPVVTVTAPIEPGFAFPLLQIDASCQDDQGSDCASFTAAWGSDILASGTSTLQQQVDLSAADGQLVRIDFTGTDVVGQTTTTSVDVYVDASTHLAPLTRQPGVIADISDTRTLFEAQSDGNLALADSADASVTSLGEALGGERSAYLYPTGAIYTTAGNIHQWEKGQVTTVDGNRALHVDGGWTIYDKDGTNGFFTLYLFQFDGNRFVVGANEDGGVGPDGTVAHTNAQDGCIYLWKSYSDARLDCPAGFGADASPRTGGLLADGATALAVYRKTDPAGTQNGIALGGFDFVDWFARTEIVLAPLVSQQVKDFQPDADYAIAGGWVAYTRADGGASRHGPQGEQSISDGIAGHVTLDAIAPDGTVVFHTDAGRRYAAVPGLPTEDVAAAFGRVIYRDVGFVEVIGGVALTLTP